MVSDVVQKFETGKNYNHVLTYLVFVGIPRTWAVPGVAVTPVRTLGFKLALHFIRPLHPLGCSVDMAFNYRKKAVCILFIGECWYFQAYDAGGGDGLELHKRPLTPHRGPQSSAPTLHPWGVNHLPSWVIRTHKVWLCIRACLSARVFEIELARLLIPFQCAFYGIVIFKVFDYRSFCATLVFHFFRFCSQLYAMGAPSRAACHPSFPVPALFSSGVEPENVKCTLLDSKCLLDHLLGSCVSLSLGKFFIRPWSRSAWRLYPKMWILDDSRNEC